MNIQSHPAPAPSGMTPLDGPLERLTVERHSAPGAIENEWRLLEATAIGTVFQRFDWVDAYARNVMPHGKSEPAILLGRLDGRPGFILPLALRRIGPATIATCIGGVHAGYNFGLWSSECAALVGAMPRRAITRMLADALPGVDGAMLDRMPLSHEDIEQPLANLSRLQSSTAGYALDLSGGFDAVLSTRGGGDRRRKVRSKERKMQAVGQIDHGTVGDIRHAHDALAFFARQKALRLAAQGVHNSFADPGVMDFFHDLLGRSAGMPEPPLEIAQLAVAGKIRAIVGSGIHAGRINIFFMTYIVDEIVQHSPGQVLTFRHIEESCGRKLLAYDLGVGYEPYKLSWCDIEHRLVDACASFTARGAVVVGAVNLAKRAKLSLRRHDALWSRLKSLRNVVRRRRLSGESPPAGDSGF